MRRIDDSHDPFKRKGSIGPGPRRRPKIHNQDDWECVNKKPTKKHYVTVCTYVGDVASRRGKKRIIRRNKPSKKRYNRLYRAWSKTHRTGAAGPRRGYRCRKTANTKCR